MQELSDTFPSKWGVLDLFQIADGCILGLMNLCSGGNSHHEDFANGDANSLYLVSSGKLGLLKD